MTGEQGSHSHTDARLSAGFPLMFVLFVRPVFSCQGSDVVPGL